MRIMGTWSFYCKDCGRDTRDEYYMVEHRLWAEVKGAVDMLCIGCLESRLGRQLNLTDFIDCPLNREIDRVRSPRLIDRLTRPPSSCSKAGTSHSGDN